MPAAAQALAQTHTAHLSRPPEEVAHDLQRFAELLLKWNARQNLVSRETVDQLWERHIADSLQVLPLLPEAAREAVDLGSGGGFPALPLAIARRDRLRFTLVEANAKKASFLNTVGRELGLGIAVRQARLEALEPPERAVDVITSRALARLPLLLSYCETLWGDGTVALLHKGREHVDELREAADGWVYDVVTHPSMLDSKGVILEIRNLRRRT